MKTKHLLVSASAIVVALSSFSLLGHFGEQPFAARIDFNTQVKPILNKSCITCHGGVKKASDFSLLFKEEALAPAKSGHPAIIPGDADESELIRRLTAADPEERMPLDGPPMKPEDIAVLRNWIDQGAEWGDHWAYQTPETPSVPNVGTMWSRLGLTNNPETDWATNEIDRFVLAKLHTADAPGAGTLLPAPVADKATLLRRVSLDLTGLPPTDADASTFLNDPSPNAYEKLVDRLLAASAFGEKWAGMWLDLARYADTKGYERDPGRSIWRYRDYLIKAFNTDKPYNQFLTEQLAGDLMPGHKGGLPTDEQLIATGFHRNTMNNDEGAPRTKSFG